MLFNTYFKIHYNYNVKQTVKLPSYATEEEARLGKIEITQISKSITYANTHTYT